MCSLLCFDRKKHSFPSAVIRCSGKQHHFHKTISKVLPICWQPCVYFFFWIINRCHLIEMKKITFSFGYKRPTRFLNSKQFMRHRFKCNYAEISRIFFFFMFLVKSINRQEIKDSILIFKYMCNWTTISKEKKKQLHLFKV